MRYFWSQVLDAFFFFTKLIGGACVFFLTVLTAIGVASQGNLIGGIALLILSVFVLSIVDVSIRF